MSEQLHEAAERARLERRQRLVREVAPYLEQGEHVLDATTGRGVWDVPGSPQPEASVLRVVATDRRVLVLRKKAFQQFGVQAFDYETAHVSVGFTAETGGELEILDTESRVRVIGVPELDLEPFFLICEVRMDPSRLEVSLEGTPSLLAVPEAAFPDEDEVWIREVEMAQRGISSSDDAWSVSGITPGPGSPESPGEVGSSSPAAGPAAAAEGGPGDEPVAEEGPGDSSDTPETPVIIPDPVPSLEQAAGQVQAAVLRWMLASTGARAAAYLSRSGTGEDRLQMEPRRLDAQTAMSMVRLATAVLDEPAADRPTAGDDVSVARWEGAGAERVLVLAGAGPDDETSVFGRFVLEWLESHAAAAGRGEEEAPHREEERPRLISLDLEAEEGGSPTATARLAWKGEELTGRGRGHTAVIGRHLAAARAVADALRPVVEGDMIVEHLSVTYPPMDAELVVTTVLVGAKRFVGATAAPPGAEGSAAARAVLDALNRSLTKAGEAES